MFHKVHRSGHGYLFPFDGRTHFLMVSDEGVSYTSWEHSSEPGADRLGFWGTVEVVWTYLTDHLSCADKWAWQAITE